MLIAPRRPTFWEPLAAFLLCAVALTAPAAAQSRGEKGSLTRAERELIRALEAPNGTRSIPATRTPGLSNRLSPARAELLELKVEDGAPPDDMVRAQTERLVEEQLEQATGCFPGLPEGRRELLRWQLSVRPDGTVGVKALGKKPRGYACVTKLLAQLTLESAPAATRRLKVEAAFGVPLRDTTVCGLPSPSSAEVPRVKPVAQLVEIDTSELDSARARELELRVRRALQDVAACNAEGTSAEAHFELRWGPGPRVSLHDLKSESSSLVQCMARKLSSLVVSDPPPAATSIFGLVNSQAGR